MSASLWNWLCSSRAANTTVRQNRLCIKLLYCVLCVCVCVLLVIFLSAADTHIFSLSCLFAEWTRLKLCAAVSSACECRIRNEHGIFNTTAFTSRANISNGLTTSVTHPICSYMRYIECAGKHICNRDECACTRAVHEQLEFALNWNNCTLNAPFYRFWHHWPKLKRVSYALQKCGSTHTHTHTSQPTKYHWTDKRF